LRATAILRLTATVLLRTAVLRLTAILRLTTTVLRLPTAVLWLSTPILGLSTILRLCPTVRLWLLLTAILRPRARWRTTRSPSLLLCLEVAVSDSSAVSEVREGRRRREDGAKGKKSQAKRDINTTV
jgi:hypothetical protein